MQTQLPPRTKDQQGRDEHRVLQFRPRTLPNSVAKSVAKSAVQSLAKSPGKSPAKPPHLRHDFIAAQPDYPRGAKDLSRYEQDREAPDDFRHRMIANAAAFALTVVLIAIGIWLAMSIAEMRNTQDCVLMGRRDCARIASPPAPLI
jgi:hypothetical protein